MDATDNPDGHGPDDPADEREPYEPPQIECEELFEVLAITCGKTQPNRFSCIRVPRLS